MGKPPKGAAAEKAAAVKKALDEEKVWNDEPGDPDGDGTGGGVSEFFTIPDWQLGTMQSTMRMVPDVAAHADPATGYRIVVAGKDYVVGGTSAAAALYAGLLAAFGPKRGFILPDLYRNNVCFNDIKSGDNGMFRALVGPDACTGLGSPKGKLLAGRIGDAEVTLKRVWGVAISASKRRDRPTGVCSCGTSAYPSPRLTPRLVSRSAIAAAVPCPSGSVANGTPIPSPTYIRVGVLAYAAPGINAGSIADDKPIFELMPGITDPVGLTIWRSDE